MLIVEVAAFITVILTNNGSKTYMLVKKIKNYLSVNQATI